MAPRSSKATRARPAGRVKAGTRELPRPPAALGKAAARRPPASKAPLPMPRALIDAGSDPDVVALPARRAVAIDGAGPPDGGAFASSLGALYGGAYGLKFARKGRGAATFAIGPLEGRWWAEGAGADLATAPRAAWRWRLRIAVPDDVGHAELGEVVRAATSKKGGKLEGSAEALRLFVERIAPARHGRILHVGPYSEEPRSFARIDAALAQAGLRPARSHVEIYLSDPRRTAPARLRTVLLRELA